MSSFLRKMNPLGKTHKYETLAAFVDMTPEEIVRIDPSDIGSHIMEETGGVSLPIIKKRAIYRLLAIKQQEKKIGVNLEQREKLIQDFLKREGIIANPEVDDLIVKTTMDVLDEDIRQKAWENRLRKLRDESIIPYTLEEKLRIKLVNLKPNQLEIIGLRPQDLESIGGKRTSRKANKKTSRKANKKTSRKTNKKISRKANKKTSRKRSSRKRC